MRKNIDLDEAVLTKLKVISAFENVSVKGLMERAIRWYVSEKEKESYAKLTQEEKEDLGLMVLMQQADLAQATEEEFFQALREE